MSAFLPRHYMHLFPLEALQPGDLVNISALLVWSLEHSRADLGNWYRPLGLALFERFKLVDLPQYRAFTEATTEATGLRQVLGDTFSPSSPMRERWMNPLGRAWMLRRQLLSLAEVGVGVLEGDAFALSVFNRGIPEPLRPMAEHLSRQLGNHAHASLPIAQELDRAIVALWGCPLERLEEKVTVAELAAAGLEIQSFEP